MTPEALRAQLKQQADQVEAYLADCLGLLPGLPAGLRTAMEYSLLAGGKRLRPILCLTFAQAAAPQDGDMARSVMPFAAAIECIHTYSLIHDDLPAMDNDDLRRGKPSSHKQFGEATAILAGDALLTDAFFLMTSAGRNLPSRRVLEAVDCMARAAGGPGMVGGQYLDMLYTQSGKADLEELRAMHAMKTGALITASCVCGAILGGADTEGRDVAAEYGRALGAAFQIMDDVLDETGDETVLGKPVGSDAASGKPTYPSLLGLDRSRDLAVQESRRAIAALPDSGISTVFLRALARYVVDRNS